LDNLDLSISHYLNTLYKTLDKIAIVLYNVYWSDVDCLK
jgi:hypothetical protein